MSLSLPDGGRQFQLRRGSTGHYNTRMKLADFHYDLPERLIAQAPLAERSASRLLHLERASGRWHDRVFRDLPDLLNSGDLLVFNNTRVIPARLQATKASGGRVEILLERLLSEHLALVQLRANRKPRPGLELEIAPAVVVTLIEREDNFWLARVDQGPAWPELLERHGHMPLPPYITRSETPADRERYQTVYAKVPGAVAAPTAGLHFDAAVFERLAARSVARAWCTLHVGAGTFQPVRVMRIEDHRMHAEWLEVDDDLVAAVDRAQGLGGRIIAVGTTAVRALETAGADGRLRTFAGDSRLFIHPGYRFRVVDAMITNFHLPGSTLMMLVSAFAGRERVLAAYAHAVQEEYRFFSYGDAMLIT